MLFQILPEFKKPN